MFYIDSDKCTGCGVCVSACPQQAISIQNDVAVINQGLCSQCGTCATVCPADAIRSRVPVYTEAGKGGDIMRGRGWFGRGYPGWGRGNPYPFCRFYPRLPRRGWAYGPRTYHPTFTPYRWW